MDLARALRRNYLPYAKTVITMRAIPGIDGFKPVQRRIMYTMYIMGLLTGNKVKSQDIVGTTMRLHPNGDSSIYDAMVLMGSGREQLNVPWIESKGNFGKVYSDIAHAAPRYTEAKLSAVSKELFDGINENAIDMVPNFDNSREEPALLPVKFPSILVNNTYGIAVGTSSCIPSFSLKSVCEATIGRLNGTINDFQTLAKALGHLEFTTGAFVHTSDRLLEHLCETGKGSFVLSSRAELYNNKIVITEIPYNTTDKAILTAISNLVKEKKITGIQEARDESGLNGLRLEIDIRKGYNSRDILKQLYNLTPLRTTISFRTKVIVDKRCKELNLMGVIDHWIKFRRDCVKRIYTYRLQKQTEKEHLLSLWDKIKDHIQEIIKMIASNTNDAAKNNLMNMYGLDDIQADFLLDMKIRNITKDKALAELEKLDKIREDIKFSTAIVTDDKAKDELIIEELREIIKTYGTESKTTPVRELTPEDTEEKKVEISSEDVVVVLTDTGYLKRLTSIKDLAGKYVSKNGDEEVRRWLIKNDSHLLVFDRFGCVHKILVDTIDTSAAQKLTDKLTDLAGVEKQSDIIWVDKCDDYSGYFNIIYPNGKGLRVYYSKAKGNRAKYKSLYDEVQPNNYWVTQEDKFFMITNREKATYVDITTLGMFSNRSAFKVARLSNGDSFKMLQPYNKVPNVGLIDLGKYHKEYTVAIRDDVLYVKEGQVVPTPAVTSANNNEEASADAVEDSKNENSNVDTIENTETKDEEVNIDEV